MTRCLGELTTPSADIRPQILYRFISLVQHSLQRLILRHRRSVAMSIYTEVFGPLTLTAGMSNGLAVARGAVHPCYQQRQTHDESVYISINLHYQSRSSGETVNGLKDKRVTLCVMAEHTLVSIKALCLLLQNQNDELGSRTEIRALQ